MLADETSARNILLSLSDLSRDHERVDRKLQQLRNSRRGDERLQRSIVLDLLQGLRGVSIHELGKVDRGKPKKRTAFQEQYMGAQGGGMQVEEQARIVRGGSPGLEGVAGMFGDA